MAAGAGTSFRIAAPAAEIAPFIQYYWELRTDTPATEECFLPGTSPVLIISKRDDRAPLHYRGRAAPQPAAFIKGILVESARLESPPVIWNVGVAFRAGAARPLLGASVGAWRDAIADVADAGDGELRDLVGRVRDAPDLERAKTVLDACFSRRLRAAHAVDARGWRMLSQIERGVFSVRALARQSGLSERQLRRVFDDEVGASPSTVIRIVRVRRAVELLRDGTLPLVRVAAAAGYYDQAHLGRELRVATGTTPARFRVDEGSVAALFRDGRSIQD